MKVITMSGDTATVSNAGIFSWFTGAYFKPVTLQPITGGQALLFGGTLFLTGCIIGGTVARKHVERVASVMRR